MKFVVLTATEATVSLRRLFGGLAETRLMAYLKTSCDAVGENRTKRHQTVAVAKQETEFNDGQVTFLHCHVSALYSLD